MVPIPIAATVGAEPYRYELLGWDCRNAVIKQIIGQSQDDLNVQINVVQKLSNNVLLVEPLKYGRQLSPTSFEINHLIEDCSKTYIEIISTTAGSDVRLMLLYE